MWGWRRALLAALAGAVGALAQAPFDALPVFFVSLTVLVWLLDGTGGRGMRAALAAAGIGWAFGFGYFLAGLYWVGAAFLVERELFGWLMPFAVLLLPAGLGLFTAFGTALARLLWSPGPWRIAALAFGLGLADWLRGTILTGFPWIAFGQAPAAYLPLAQSASLVGLYGLSVVTVAIFASPAALVGAGRRRAGALVLSLFLFAAMAGYGAWRLSAPEPETAEGVSLRIVQPSIDQRDKWRPELLNEVLAHYLALSDRPTSPDRQGIGDITHLVWPETALPVVINEAPDVLAAIAQNLGEGTHLYLGAVRSETAEDGSARFYNSLYVLDDEGGLVNRYDKTHLVPFGEYLPFRGLLERIGLRQLTELHGGFAAGSRRTALTAGAAPPAAALVCYEIIFPGAALPQDEPRPGWLLNVTNDGWFGATSGPYQHLAQARLRAIEEGLPLVRAANTGISAVVDAKGRIVASLGLGREGVVDAQLPGALPPTLFSRHGWIAPLTLYVVMLAGAVFGRLRRGNRYV